MLITGSLLNLDIDFSHINIIKYKNENMSGPIALNQFLNEIAVGPLFSIIIALCANFSLKEYSTINSRIVFQDMSNCYMSFTADTADMFH